MKSRRYVTSGNNATTANNIRHVYVKSPEHVWVPALQVEPNQVVIPKFNAKQQVLQCNGNNIKLNDTTKVDLQDYDNNVLPLQNVDAAGTLQDYKDMVQLPYVHEAAILYNLKLRHTREKPYTRTGDIVIAVNPYKWFEDLYSQKKQNYYSKRLVWNNASSESNNDDPRDTMEAHVYEVSALAYKGLKLEGQDQSILVSGESGAGKTETVKICLNHIATTQRGSSSIDDSVKDVVVERILQSNPLLEAFGNAKTRRNDNSSRFGKYLQLQFNNVNSSNGNSGISYFSRQCALVGSVCDVYLLEKNRVVSHDAQERTFHIFYQLLAAKTKTKFWKNLQGKTAADFDYVGASTTTSIEGVSDADRFDDTVEALAMVGIKDEKLQTLMRAICVVMQIGNIKFSGDNDTSNITTKDHLSDLADLLGVSTTDLSLALTERTFSTRDESHKVPLGAEAAADARDAMAKEIYQKTFLWLVKAINEATQAKSLKNDTTDKKYGIIGMLDIFGFEAFKTNHFEQLCINYANEKLQQKFNEDIFRNVQAEYKLEGIPLEEIKYDDNTDVLDLIEGRSGLLAMLNEECHRPKGNDISFVAKVTQMYKDDSPAFVEHKTDNLSFGIHHYAGMVMYDAETFVSRNQDTLPTDLHELCEKSTNEIVQQPQSEVAAEKKKQTTALKRGVTIRGMERTSSRNIVAPTIWEKYRNQLATLMSNLHKTKSRYIRCIKPNATKSPLLMDHTSVVEQLRCAGVIAGITISRSVFPNRLDNAVVLSRYSSLWNEMQDSFDSLGSSGSANFKTRSNEKRVKYCNKLLKKILKTKEVVKDDKVVRAFCVGKTKTYFRAGALEFLEAHRKNNSKVSDVDVAIVMLQALVRGWLVRNDGCGEAERLRLEQEQRELAERQQQEALDRQRQASQERVRAAKQEQADLMRKIRELEKETEQDKADTREKYHTALKRKQLAELESKQLKDDIADFEKKYDGGREARQQMARQKQRLEEQKRVIKWLQKENKKARKEQDRIANKIQVFKDNVDKSYNGNSSMRDMFDELDDDTHKVQVRNSGLLDAHASTKALNDQLKKKVNAMQNEYMTQAEARLELQKTLSRILTMIQDSASNNKSIKNAAEIVEECVVRALDTEAECKAIMAGIDEELELDDDYVNNVKNNNSGLPDLTISDNSDSDLSM